MCSPQAREPFTISVNVSCERCHLRDPEMHSRSLEGTPSSSVWLDSYLRSSLAVRPLHHHCQCVSLLPPQMWTNAVSTREAAALAASTPRAAISVPAQQARAAFTGTGRIAQVCGALCWPDMEMAFQGKLGNWWEDVRGRRVGGVAGWVRHAIPGSEVPSLLGHVCSSAHR